MVATGPGPKSPNTLAIDVGGTGIKASVLDANGHMEHDRVRVPTPYPLSPQKLVLEVQKLIADLPAFDRISVGFPGMVRGGRILSAPHFVSPDGPFGSPEPKLVRAWNRFDLASALAEVTGKPTKVANDADIQGAAVISGKGFEAVVTLGTGVGTAFFLEGKLLPHFEFAHHPLGRAGTYNDVLGDATRQRIGNRKWRKRVVKALGTLRALTFYDHCYVGGGNSARLGTDLPDGVSVVDNSAGILGGIKLWERSEPPITTRARSTRTAAKTRPATKRTTPAKRTPAVPSAPVEPAPAEETSAESATPTEPT